MIDWFSPLRKFTTCSKGCCCVCVQKAKTAVQNARSTMYSIDRQIDIKIRMQASKQQTIT